jgi:anthranilate synthase component II
MKKVLVIDNYDSFTFNLVHYLEELDCEVIVLRNDEFELDEISEYNTIILSPGAGIPSKSGLMNKVISTYASSKKILGICLGQQAIGEVFGGSLLNLNKVYHGVATTIKVIVDDEILFKNLPKQLNVGRYHSWTINPTDFPNDLEVTSIDENDEIMSIRHKIFNVKGVQFHPESILTPYGKTILSNWINE